MSPLFRRGELKAALLDVIATVEPANGYVIMQVIADALDGAWQPSPGAVYPALLGLEDAGLIDGTDRAGARLYSLSATGRRALPDIRGTLDDVAARVRAAPPRGRPVGRIVDEWAGALPRRDRRLNADHEQLIQRALIGVAELVARLADDRPADD